MSYFKHLGDLFFESAELEPAVRNLAVLGDEELRDQAGVARYLREIGLAEAAARVSMMSTEKYHQFLAALDLAEVEDSGLN